MFDGQMAFRRIGSARGCDSSKSGEHGGCRSIVGIGSSSNGDETGVGRLRREAATKTRDDFELPIDFNSAKEEGEAVGEQ